MSRKLFDICRVMSRNSFDIATVIFLTSFARPFRDDEHSSDHFTNYLRSLVLDFVMATDAANFTPQQVRRLFC